MIGLLIKDYYLLKKNAKFLVSIILLYGIISIFSNSSFTFFGGMIVILMITLVTTTFSYDEYNKWNKYVLSLPLSRNDIVKSKYILAILLLLTGIALSFVFSSISFFKNKNEFAEVVGTLCVCSAFGLFLMGTYIPFIYHLGVEKSRPVLIVCAMVPFIMTLLFSKIDLLVPSEKFLEKLIWFMPLVACIYFMGSYFISCKIFRKKDL